MQPQKVLLRFQAVHYDKKKFFLINWPFSLTTNKIHVPHMQRPSILHQQSLMAKSLTPVCTSKDLSNFANLSTVGKDNLFLSSPKTWWQGLSHVGDSHFFHKLDKVGWSLRLMFPYAMAINFALTSVNNEVPRLHMHLKMLMKTQEINHILRKELVF